MFKYVDTYIDKRRCAKREMALGAIEQRSNLKRQACERAASVLLRLVVWVCPVHLAVFFVGWLHSRLVSCPSGTDHGLASGATADGDTRR